MWTSRRTWVKSNIKKAPSRYISAAPIISEPKKEEALIQLLEVPYQLKTPIKCLKGTEVQKVLPIIGIKFLTNYSFQFNLKRVKETENKS
jgi:hypothetical protein